MKILVCGGRDYGDYNKMLTVMHGIQCKYGQQFEICQGGARGADRLAKMWAERNHIKCTEFPAKWDLYGRAAGMIRNQQMLDEFKPDHVIAFPGGIGTEGMCRIAKKAGIPVQRIV